MESHRIRNYTLSLFVSLILNFFSASPVFAIASTYYVSSQNGNDSSGQGSLSSPWATIPKGISDMTAGDTLYVRAGNYPGFSVTKSGTDSLPITIKGYENEMPVISGGPIKIYKQSYIVISGFEVTGSTTVAGIRSDSSSYVTISGNKVHDNLGTDLSGIMILNAANNKILNNIVYNNDFAGIRVYGSSSVNTEIANNTVYGHTASAGDSDGIDCDGSASTMNIHHNTVYNNSDDGIDSWSCHHNMIAYNTVYGNGGTGDGNGIKAGGSTTGGANTIMNNISYNNLSDGITSNGSSGNKYYHNVSYQNGKYGISDGWRNETSNGLSILINNIAYKNTQADVSLASGMTSASHNNLWGVIRWNGTIYSGLDSFYSASLLDNPSAGALSSLQGDPLFVNPTAFDFHLQPNSPAINRGDPSNPAQIVASGIPDLGALEFGGTVPIPSPSPSPQSRPGDANGDGKIDGIDYVIWVNHYNQSVSGSINGDFNQNGMVDGIDYVIWLTNYGK